MDVRPGYKRTEVGVIPDSWSLRPLGELGKWLSGGTPSMSIDSYWSGEFPWVSAKDMKASRLHDSIDHITSKAVADGARLAPAGTVLIVIRGMILAHSFPVGRAERSLAFNQDIKAVIAGADVDSNFLLYWLMANAQKLRGLTTESTHGTKRLPTEMLFRELVACPPPLEQQAIANALTDADALIESLEQLLTKKRQIKKGAMQALLTGKKRLPGFSGEWETRALDGVLSRVNAKVHQIPTSEYQATGRHPVVDQGKERVIGFSDRQDKLFRCPKGGVIVFGDHTCIVKFVDFDFLVGADGTQVLEAKSGQYSSFHALQLQHSGVTPTGYNRHFKFLKEREFVAPPLQEQTAIATILSDMDEEITALESRLSKARLLKQGMMQELLTGRIRLL